MKKSVIVCCILLFFLTVFVWVVKLLNIDNGFFTFYDQAYFLLKAKEAYQGLIDGISQWNLIAIKWFPYLDLTSKISSLIAGYILYAATCVNAIIACVFAFGKRHTLLYIAISTLLFLYSGEMLYYVTIQAFLLCSSLSSFIIYYKSSSYSLGKVMLVITGCFVGLSLFVILPGAALSLLGYAIIIVILNRHSIKECILSLVFGFIGVVISCAYILFFISDIGSILCQMSFTASYISEFDYGYDPISFVTRIALFLRDCIFVLVFYCGAYYMANFFAKKTSHQWFCGVIYMLLAFIYLYYQKKPIVTSAMFFSSIVVIPFVFGKGKHLDTEHFWDNRNMIYLFLFCFPLMASIGTNTPLSGRISYFIFAWALIWFDYVLTNETSWYVGLTAIVAIILPMTVNSVHLMENTDNSTHFDKGNKNFAKIRINSRQKEYFDNVYDLVNAYGYQRDSSILFTASFDYATALALDAKLSSNFYQINKFLVWDKKQMLKPDFIILCGWDEIVAGDVLKQTGWGWPEEFDAYDMGTPENTVVTDAAIEQRTVYCRKSLRILPYSEIHHSLVEGSLE